MLLFIIKGAEIMNGFINNIKSNNLLYVGLILLCIGILWIYLIIKNKGSKAQAIICALLTIIGVFLSFASLVSNNTTDIDSIISTETVIPSMSVDTTNQTETYISDTTVETTINETTINTFSSTTAKWHETELYETLYIKTSCYSRIEAIVGSDAVKKYEAGIEISVVAATDTGYYKLSDGTFIHSDYITDIAPTTQNSSVMEINKNNKNSVTLINGDQTTLSVSDTSETVTWSTGDKNIAIVSSKGVVVGKAPGTTYIYAQTGGTTIKCRVTVVAAEITASSSNVTFDKNGDTKDIIITVKGSHSGLTVGTTDKSVATASWVRPIQWDGDKIKVTITAQGSGTANIKVYLKDYPNTCYCYIKVKV